MSVEQITSSFTVSQLEKSLTIETSVSTCASDTEPESPLVVSGNEAPEWEYHNTRVNPATVAKTYIPIPQPEVMQNILYPLSPDLQNKILHNRSIINNSLISTDSPFLVITGPTYIKDTNQIKACAQYLALKQGNSSTNTSDFLPSEVKSIFSNPTKLSNLQLLLRTNLSKYNHSYNSPTLQTIRTFEIDQGVPKCRSLLRELSNLAPLVSEFVDTLTPQYLGDFFSMGIVGSSLIESQLHRELASGSSYAVGFNSGETGEMLNHRLTSCLDSIYATSQPHQFLSVTKYGTVAVVGTTGNNDTFVILPLVNNVVKLVEKINSYKNLSEKCVKVLLDLGMISNDEYNEKLETLKNVLNSQVKSQLLGVMIDSGDHYVPYDLDLTENSDNESLFTLVDTDKKKKSSSTDSLSSFAPDINYEYFINANNFLVELNNLV